MLGTKQRGDLFFLAHSWAGTPQIREPHKCTKLVWADPDDPPGDALDFIVTAPTGAVENHAVREFLADIRWSQLVQGLSVQARDGATREDLEAVITCAMAAWANRPGVATRCQL